MYSRLTIKTPKRRHWRRSDALLLTLKRFYILFWCFRCWLWTIKCRLGNLCKEMLILEIYWRKFWLDNSRDHSFSTLAKLICAYPVGIYLLKVNNRNSRTRCEIRSKLTIKITERRHWRKRTYFSFCSSISVVNFDYVIARQDMTE